jgi:hypothetical protein
MPISFLTLKQNVTRLLTSRYLRCWGYASPGSLLNLSMGISWHHLVPFNAERITPAKNNSYYPQAVSFTDSGTGVKTDYTFRGTKVASSLTIDPKHFSIRPYW